MDRAFRLLTITALSLLCACGPRGGKTAPDASGPRDFPRAEIPSMYTDAPERAAYATGHFWDYFTDTTRLYACDSATVNGVPLAVVESQMGLFASLLGQVPLDEGGKAVARLYDRADAFERKYPDSNVFEELGRLVRHYLYDPNSPVRNEDLYGEFVSRLGKSDLIDSGYRMGYEWDARMCRLNRVGTKAADFAFTDTRGWIRTLYSIKAEYTVLIFGNPGCKACQEMMEAMIIFNDSGQARNVAIALPDANGQNVYANHTLPTYGVLSVRIQPAPQTALSHTSVAAPVAKRIVGGQLLLDRDGKTYNVLGQIIQ